MAKLTEEMKEFIPTRLAFIATATPDGIPCIGPKGTTRVLDDEHIIFGEVTGKHCYENVQKNPWVAIAVVDAEKLKGFRFLGKAELITEGPVYEGAKEALAKRGIPAPKAVVNVKVEEIYNLGFPGAGERIA